jgi:hypothetical protein
MTRLLQGDAAARLIDSLRINPDKYEAFLLPMFAMPRRSSLDAKLRRLTSRIPCFLLRQSFDSLGTGADLIEGLVMKELT